MKKSIEKLLSLIETYEQIPNDSVDINTILHLKKYLVINLVYFATEMQEAIQFIKVQKETLRQRQNDIKLECQEKKYSIEKSNQFALANTKEQSIKLAELEGVYEGYKHIDSAVKEVIMEMSQRISVLKNELSNLRAL